MFRHDVLLPSTQLATSQPKGTMQYLPNHALAVRAPRHSFLHSLCTYLLFLALFSTVLSPARAAISRLSSDWSLHAAPSIRQTAADLFKLNSQLLSILNPQPGTRSSSPSPSPAARGVCQNAHQILCHRLLRSALDISACISIITTARRPSFDPFPNTVRDFAALGAARTRRSVDAVRTAGLLSLLLQGRLCKSDISSTGLAAAGLAAVAVEAFEGGGGRVSVAVENGRPKVLWCRGHCPDEDKTWWENRPILVRRPGARKLLISPNMTMSTQVTLSAVVEVWLFVVEKFPRCNTKSVKVTSCPGGWMMNSDCEEDD